MAPPAKKKGSSVQSHNVHEEESRRKGGRGRLWRSVVFRTAVAALKGFLSFFIPMPSAISWCAFSVPASLAGKKKYKHAMGRGDTEVARCVLATTAQEERGRKGAEF